MQYRMLGGVISVSEVGLGAMALTQQQYGEVDETESAHTLNEAIDSGITLIDTAETYGVDHANERFLGRELRGRRDEVVLTTKFGLKYDIEHATARVNGDPRNIKTSCDASLSRLQTDYIDIYYLHRVDKRYPIEEVWGEFSQLISAGKVRYLGMSEPTTDALLTAHSIHPVTVVQNEYSLFTRDPEHGLTARLSELGIGFVCFAPLGRGVLSGQFRSADDFAKNDLRRNLPRFQDGNLQRNLRIVDELAAYAKSLGLSTIQLAIAWLLNRTPKVVPIPGMETRSHLRHNLGAIGVTLSEAQIAEIDDIVPDGAIGARYAAEVAALSEPDTTHPDR